MKTFNEWIEYFKNKTGYFSIDEFLEQNPDINIIFKKTQGFVLFEIDKDNNLHIIFICGRYSYLSKELIKYGLENDISLIYAETSRNIKSLVKSFKYSGADYSDLTDSNGYKVSITPLINHKDLITNKQMYSIKFYLK